MIKQTLFPPDVFRDIDSKTANGINSSLSKKTAVFVTQRFLYFVSSNYFLKRLIAQPNIAYTIFMITLSAEGEKVSKNGLDALSPISSL